MSFEILENRGHTIYAPLNTTIDADRDYGLAELEACGCAGGVARTQIQGVAGFYQDYQLSPGMLGGTPGTSPLWPHAQWHRNADGTLNERVAREMGYQSVMLSDLEEAAIPTGVWMFGALAAGWALWAWYTPHQEVAY